MPILLIGQDEREGTRSRRPTDYPKRFVGPQYGRDQHRHPLQRIIAAILQATVRGDELRDAVLLHVLKVLLRLLP